MNRSKVAALISELHAVGTPKRGVTKTAAAPIFSKSMRGLLGDAAKIMGVGALLGGGGTLAAHAIGTGVHGVESVLDYKTSKSRLRKFDPELFKSPTSAKTTETYLNTLTRIAPTLARDPVVSSSFIRRMKQMPETALGMAKDLAAAEGRLRDVRGDKLSSKVPGFVPAISGPGFYSI